MPYTTFFPSLTVTRLACILTHSHSNESIQVVDFLQPCDALLQIEALVSCIRHLYRAVNSRVQIKPVSICLRAQGVFSSTASSARKETQSIRESKVKAAAKSK